MRARVLPTLAAVVSIGVGATVIGASAAASGDAAPEPPPSRPVAFLSDEVDGLAEARAQWEAAHQAAQTRVWNETVLANTIWANTIWNNTVWNDTVEANRRAEEARAAEAARKAAAASTSRTRAAAAPAPARSSGGGGGAGGVLASIRACESGGNYGAVSSSGRYRGAYQFDMQTWRGVGGSGDPAAASPAEQDARAAQLMAQRGTSPWPICGR